MFHTKNKNLVGNVVVKKSSTMVHINGQHQTSGTYYGSFKCVNYLKGDQYDIIGIVRGELTASSTPSAPRQWIKISRDLNKVNFLAMSYTDSSNEVEERYFDEGYLKFDTKKGTFIEKFNFAQHQLLVTNVDLLPKQLINWILNM